MNLLKMFLKYFIKINNLVLYNFSYYAYVIKHLFKLL